MTFYDTMFLGAVIPGTLFFVLMSVIHGLASERIYLSKELRPIILIATFDFILVTSVSLVLLFISDYYGVIWPGGEIPALGLTFLFLVGLSCFGYIAVLVAKIFK